ncbi:50S ribosome-binding GTPase [Pectobacterium versatile]|uniref:GTPase family protein n=1 Tax=Pectobacterium versatile TaxID=2488639 RepID=UPI0015DFDA0A|nr:GTPase [Pectobacterium versatile]MBA0162264.1 50S ribosome-binding GTPase [Pectobacterium versatile]GKV80670.1 HSR1-like GTP-binding protein [Pectobacterium carotovorum subsp. carotovorum]
MKKSSGYSLIRRHLRRYPRSLRHALMQELTRLVTYEPVIGIMGKTGVGKSSLCNALFRSEVCAVNAVAACTREPQRIRLRFGRHYLTLVDLPGVGESQQRDEEYRALYQSLLPELDMVLWVLKADDRAYSAEEQFYRDVFGSVNGGHPPILWLLNQVDKIEPSEEWHWASAQPSSRQREHMAQKQAVIGQQLGIVAENILPLSVKGRYQLGKMVEAMITLLPKQARSPVIPHLRAEHQTDSAVQQARAGFSDTVVSAVDWVIDHSPLPQVAKQVLHGVTHSVARAANAVWSFFFD